MILGTFAIKARAASSLRQQRKPKLPTVEINGAITPPLKAPALPAMVQTGRNAPKWLSALIVYPHSE